MALHILPILKALAPLVANAGGLVAGLRATAQLRTEDRLAKLEQETLRAGEVLRGLAEQVQALARELEVQARQTDILRRRARIALSVSVVALGAAISVLVLGLAS